MQRFAEPYLFSPFSNSAENRYKFSRMCDSIEVDQPKWKELTSVEDAQKFAAEVGYPCLMRPSYILSGTAMRVAHSANDLANDFKTAVVVSRDYPVVLTKFILGEGRNCVTGDSLWSKDADKLFPQKTDAKEIEIDAVANKGEIVVSLISEHVENAGVHSVSISRGDGTYRIRETNPPYFLPGRRHDCAPRAGLDGQDHCWLPGDCGQDCQEPVHHWPLQHPVHCQG